MNCQARRLESPLDLGFLCGANFRRAKLPMCRPVTYRHSLPTTNVSLVQSRPVSIAEGIRADRQPRGCPTGGGKEKGASADHTTVGAGPPSAAMSAAVAVATPLAGPSSYPATVFPGDTVLTLPADSEAPLPKLGPGLRVVRGGGGRGSGAHGGGLAVYKGGGGAMPRTRTRMRPRPWALHRAAARRFVSGLAGQEGWGLEGEERDLLSDLPTAGQGGRGGNFSPLSAPLLPHVYTTAD